MQISFTIPAIPVAQPRQRTRIVGGPSGSFAQNYTPAKHPVNAFKASARHAMKAAYDGPPLPGPLEVNVVFVFPRPAGMLWKKRPMPRARHTKRPDRDNLEKSLCDALTGLLWLDDSQVCAGQVEKWIAAGHEQPHVEVHVRTLGLVELEPAKLFETADVL